jgi:hypothetical protein
MNYKNINFRIEPLARAPDIGVCLSIKIDKSVPCCFKKLLCNIQHRNPKLMNGSEESALAFSMFELIRDKMIGSPLESTKSKVSNIKPKILNNNLVIYWNCMGNLSALRKSLSLAVSTLNPNKLYSRYSENLKFLGGVAKRDYFEYIAGKVANNILEGIDIVAVGRVKIKSSDKVKEMLASVHKKIPPLKKSSKSTMKSEKREYESTYSEFPVVKCKSQMNCIFVADYISSMALGMAVEVHENVVEVYSNRWPTRHKQIKGKSKISGYVKQKYGKIRDSLSATIAYHAISHSRADTAALKKLLNSKLSLSDIEKIIHEAL